MNTFEGKANARSTLVVDYHQPRWLIIINHEGFAGIDSFGDNSVSFSSKNNLLLQQNKTNIKQQLLLPPLT